MKYLALAYLLLSQVVWAEDFKVVSTPITPDAATTISLVADETGGRIFFDNNHTKGDTYLILKLSDGGIDVAVSVDNTPDGSCGRPSCPDIVTVLSLTEGFSAYPTSVEVEEGAGVTILIVPEGMS